MWKRSLDLTYGGSYKYVIFVHCKNLTWTLLFREVYVDIMVQHLPLRKCPIKKDSSSDQDR